MNRFERKISEKGVVRAGKVFTLFISNKNMNDIIKITKPLDDSRLQSRFFPVNFKKFLRNLPDDFFCITFSVLLLV